MIENLVEALGPNDESLAQDAEPMTVDRDVSLDAEPMTVDRDVSLDDNSDNTDQLEEVDPIELDLNDIDLDVEGFEGYPEEVTDDDRSSDSSGPQG